MIFYLSCTGNTKWVAETLAERLGERVVDVAKVIGGECRYTVSEGELVGFCFPVHGWRPPKLMLDFIKKLHLSGTQNRLPAAFAVCTAGDTVGEAMKIFHDECARCIEVRSFYDVKMPNTYVGLPFMDVDKKDAEEQKLSFAVKRVDEICDTIRSGKIGDFMKYIGRWPVVNSVFLGSLFSGALVTDRHFFVDVKKCAHCGKCSEVCPVSDIECVSGQVPIWKHNGKCLTCFACYHNCPMRAIQYGWMTRGKGQYRHA